MRVEVARGPLGRRRRWPLPGSDYDAVECVALEDVAARAGLADLKDEFSQTTATAAKGTRELVRDINASGLADIGVDTSNAAVIGREAEIDPSAGGNPIPVDAAALERVFRAAVAGDLAAAG